MRWVQGSAEQTGLPDGSFHLLLIRAVTHHLRNLSPCFHEAARVLRPGGMLLIQDRTPADCLLPATPDHLRGFIFEQACWLPTFWMGRSCSTTLRLPSSKEV
ncbi:class I SAM-dependent methyltransferase [Kroppenstedtia eburnea]|nr:class I SAM-dependent methyltransferase [Kroppenstedtia eburnea]